MVTTYQKQYFYTQTIEHALDFVRDIANNVQRPFGVRYNPYTHSVDVLNNQDKILDVAKELRGDLCIVATALKKVQEKEGDLETIGKIEFPCIILHTQGIQSLFKKLDE